MFSTRGVRVAVSMAVLGVTGLSCGVVGLANASAASTPKVVVTPSKNLRNGEAVKVTGSGFTPGDKVFYVECQTNAKGQSGCQLTGMPSPDLTDGIPKYATISSTGTLPPTYFRVKTGKIGNGTCGTTKTNLKKCAISVGNAGGTDSAVGDIVFKAVGKK